MAEKTEKKSEIEREYIIPLRKAWQNVPRYKKANKAIKTIKEFLARHMKVVDRDLNKVRLDKYLNEFVWARGIRNPPFKVKVKVRKDGENVIAELFELPEKMRFHQERMKKMSDKGEAGKPKKVAEKEEKAEEKTEEQKKETEEKKASTVEGMEKMEKQASKVAKHQSKGEKQKQSVPRRMTMPK